MTNQESQTNKEYNRLIVILNYRLPHRFKRIGIISALIILISIVAYKFLGSNTLIVKEVMRTFILLSLLAASLSVDTLEDEYNRELRFQSYVLAFVCAVSYAILMPLISLVADIAITKITGDGTISFHEISAFEVMFILLGFQLLFFETLKRFGRVE